MDQERLEEPTHIPVSIKEYKLLKRQAARVKELEESEREWVLFQAQVNCINQKLQQQNKRYREAIEKAINEGVSIKDCNEAINHIYGILGEALEGDCIHCNGKGFNGLDYCPQCNQLEVNDDD